MGRVQRISIVGCSGSGKTTVAREVAIRLGLPRLELDAVFHQPGWEPRDDESFREVVGSFVGGDGWVVDGNYVSHGVADLVWPHADTVVWVDPPKRVVMSRVVRRTLRRVITREELWNGNREPWSNLYRRDPYENIIVWAWTRHPTVRERYEAMLDDGTWAHLDVVRLRTRRDVRGFLRSVG
jgi:adenylate kinase family enzyme